MKKILIISFLFLSLILQATTYYTGGGSDVSGNGTIARPWATLKHATDTITQTGNTIYINVGTCTETTQSTLATGVNIDGAGVTSVIHSHIAGTSYTLLLSSTNEGTNGNQSISNIKMDGDNLTAYAAIYIFKRSNVEIHNCTFINFNIRGVKFLGGSEPPTTWATGNKFYNNIVTNCAGEEDVYNDGKIWQQRALTIGGQEGFLCYNNVMDQSGRGAGLNGLLIGTDNGYNKGLKIYDNTMTMGPFDGPDAYGTNWYLAIEVWNSLGGIEIYNNTIASGTIDVAGMFTSDVAGYGYAVKIYNNIIGNDAPASQMETGIVLEMAEGYSMTGGIYIYNNLLKHLGRPISTAVMRTGNGTFEDIYIYYNLIRDVGCTATTWNCGIVFFPSPSGTNHYHNINILNNTIATNPAIAGNWADGIKCEFDATSTDITIRNNIILGFGEANILFKNAIINGLSVENNLFAGNGGISWSNGPVYTNCTLTNNVEQNNVEAAPLLVSTSDFHLQSGSPAKDTGIDVGLTLDYDGNNIPFNTLFDIGAYEYGSGAVRLLIINGKVQRKVTGEIIMIRQ